MFPYFLVDINYEFKFSTIKTHSAMCPSVLVVYPQMGNVAWYLCWAGIRLAVNFLSGVL